MSREYEDSINLYLTDLKNSGVILDGSPIGINEQHQTAVAKVSVISSESVSEKNIIIYKVNDVFNWKFYNQADQTLLYEYSNDDWTYKQFSKRIVAPVELILQYSSFETWFRLNNLPIVKIDSILYCYCNTILPEHQSLIDTLVDVIKIEDRP